MLNWGAVHAEQGIPMSRELAYVSKYLARVFLVGPRVPLCLARDFRVKAWFRSCSRDFLVTAKIHSWLTSVSLLMSWGCVGGPLRLLEGVSAILSGVLAWPGNIFGTVERRSGTNVTQKSPSRAQRHYRKRASRSMCSQVFRYVFGGIFR